MHASSAFAALAQYRCALTSPARRADGADPVRRLRRRGRPLTRTGFALRHITAQERAVAKRTYDRFVDLYRGETDDARDLLGVGDSAFDAALPVTESAAWTMLASQLFNLDEVLNK